MKRFLLFAFRDYYPIGGWDDFKESYDTLEEAASAGRATLEDLYCNFQVVDSATGEVTTK